MKSLSTLYNTQDEMSYVDFSVHPRPTLSQYTGNSRYVVPTIIISAPTLTVEGAPNDVPESPTLTGDDFEIIGGFDSHAQTDWEVRDMSDNVVWSQTSV